MVDASYRREKVPLLEDANRRLEVLRWLLRMATDRKVLTGRQYEYICEQLTECGRMIGDWLKQQQRASKVGGQAGD